MLYLTKVTEKYVYYKDTVTKETIKYNGSIISLKDSGILGLTIEPNRYFCFSDFDIACLGLIDDIDTCSIDEADLVSTRNFVNYFIWDNYGVVIKNFTSNLLTSITDLVYNAIKFGMCYNNCVYIKSTESKVIRVKLVDNWKSIYTKLLVLEK